MRAALLAGLVPGSPCPQGFTDGTICGRPMWPGQPLALGHNNERTGYIGLVHAHCNNKAGAMWGAMIRTGKVRPARPQRTVKGRRPW